MIKKLNRLVVKTFPDLELAAGYLVKYKPEHLLVNGYFIESTPSAMYVNRFVYPMFLHVENEFSLNFSKRIARFSKQKMDNNLMTEKILETILQDKEHGCLVCSAQEFVTYIDNMPEVLGNQKIELAYGIAKFLCNDLTASKKHILNSIEVLKTLGANNSYKQYIKLYELIESKDVESAQGVVNEWVADNWEKVRQ